MSSRHLLPLIDKAPAGHCDRVHASRQMNG